MCLALACRKTMAAAPHVARWQPKNESRIVRLNVSGGSWTRHGTESRSGSVCICVYMCVCVWPETKRIRWRKLK